MERQVLPPGHRSAPRAGRQRRRRRSARIARALTLGVVVPTLDEERHLPGLLAALRAEPEAARPDEVWVVDGGSTDGTRELAHAAGARVEQTARGRGTQLGHGGRCAGTDLMLFLHADTRPEPGALAALRAAFGEQAGLAAAGMRQRIDAEGRLYRWIERAADRRVRRGWVYGDSGLCVRRGVYLDLGGFRDVPLFEDVEFSARLRRCHAVELVERATLRISARRWEGEGIVRATLRNRLLRTAFALGVEPEHLIRYYRPFGHASGRKDPAR